MSLLPESTVPTPAGGEVSVLVEPLAGTDLIVQPIEVVFRMQPGEILWVFNNGETFNYSKSQRKLMLLGSLFAVVALVTLVTLAVKAATGVPVSKLSAFVPLLAIAGYRAFTFWRAWKKQRASLHGAYASAQDMVFRATRNGFSLTDPGVRETSVNWTAVTYAGLVGPFLLIYAANRVYRIPARAFPEGELRRLMDFLAELMG